MGQGAGGGPPKTHLILGGQRHLHRQRGHVPGLPGTRKEVPEVVLEVPDGGGGMDIGVLGPRGVPAAP